MSKLHFVETPSGAYAGYKDRQLFCTVERNQETSHWEARDMNGQPLSFPDMYRYDLFERLQLEYNYA